MSQVGGAGPGRRVRDRYDTYDRPTFVKWTAIAYNTTKIPRLQTCMQ